MACTASPALRAEDWSPRGGGAAPGCMFVPREAGDRYAPCVQLIIRFVVNGIALWIAALVVDGVDVEASTTTGEVLTILAIAAVFAVVNIVVRPIVKILSLPLYVITLGLFTFVVNALMLLLTSWIADLLDVPFHVDGFWSALLGGLVISFVSWMINLVLPS
jgi:putative membrane protein